MNSFLFSRTFLLIIIVILGIVLVFEIFRDEKPKENGNKLDLQTFSYNMKNQLDSLFRERNDSSLLKLDEAEVEISFVIKNESATSNRVQYEVITANNKNKYEKESIHKMNLHFKLPKTK